MTKQKLLVNLCGLNEQFCQWIKQHVDKDPYVILTPCLNDYTKHLEELKAKYGSFESLGGVSDVDKDKQEENSTKKPLLGAFFGSASESAVSVPTFGSGSTGFATSIGKTARTDKTSEISSTATTQPFSFGSAAKTTTN